MVGIMTVSERTSQRIRSCRAAFTSALACNAPKTSIEVIVARASSGVTSSANSGKAQHVDLERLPRGADRL